MNILLICVGSIASLAVIFGFGLAIASKVFAVDTDPRIDEVIEHLPGVNCGACGYAGCSAAAEAIVKGEAEADVCPVATGMAYKNIANIMGVEVAEKEPVVSVLLCSGGYKVSEKFEYNGVRDCNAAALVHGGPKSCSHGCIGLDSCVDVCPFDAITMGPDGLPEVVESICTGCGKCAEACPKNLFVIQPLKKGVHIRCSSPDKGAAVKKICDTGCIGCKKCEKICPVEAVTTENFLAKIDYNKCIACGKCVNECPQGTIASFRKARKAQVPVPSAEAVTSKDKAALPAGEVSA
ncbi:MAG: RnfABCDGE type electron transport complex subunit B [Planctomycetes bacterium]|nr:RnfABCDGE type electron transport complex subunit B [Planctomycetota bacterium]